MEYCESLISYPAQQPVLDLCSKEASKELKRLVLHDANGEVLCIFEEEFFPESPDLDDVSF